MRATIGFRLSLFFGAHFRLAGALEIDDVCHCRLDVGRYLLSAKPACDE
ncbi:MAG TPA: hypothetical protein PKY87_15330 [Terricaulis sp.]|nr:hypothetical protein [Terricaulis sp.]